MKIFTTEYKLVIGFALALMLLLLSSGLMFRSLQEYKNISFLVSRTYQVLDALGDVRSGLREIESRQRTYIITGDEHSYTEYERDAAQIRSILTSISQLCICRRW